MRITLPNKYIKFYKKERSEQARYNIAVLGKTGVGKSTLINYLLGIPVAKTGVGKPVTISVFDHYDFRLNNLPVRIFDSIGLESGKSGEWIEDLHVELDVRSADNAPSKWFHTVLYCISAGGARIEDFEIDVIKEFTEARYKVIAVLTKADQATEKERKELTELLVSLNLDMEVIPVCSEGKEFPGGNVISPFGRDELKKEIYDNFLTSIGLRLPDRCLALLNDIVDTWECEQRRYIRENLNYSNCEEIRKTVAGRAVDFLEELKTTDILISPVKNEFKSVMELYEMFNGELGLPDRNIFHDLKGELEVNKSLYGLLEHIEHLPVALFLLPFKYGIASVCQAADMFVNWVRGDINMAQDYFLDLSVDGIMNKPKHDNRKTLFDSLDLFGKQLKEGIKALKPEIETAIRETISQMKS